MVVGRDSSGFRQQKESLSVHPALAKPAGTVAGVVRLTGKSLKQRGIVRGIILQDPVQATRGDPPFPEPYRMDQRHIARENCVQQLRLKFLGLPVNIP